MDHARVHRGKALGRHVRSAVLAPALVALVAVSLGVVQPSRVEAAEGFCLPSVRGVPLVDQSVVNDGSVGDHVIYCGYTKKTKKRYVGSIHLTLQWIDAGSKAESWVDPEERCAPSPGEVEGWIYPYQGEKMIRVFWSATAGGDGNWDKKGVRAAKELAATVVDRASSCGPVHSVSPDRAVTDIELTGERVKRLEDEGGIGAIIELTPDERDALVASMGSERITDEHLGRRGRVIEVGTVATSADGDKVVSVTVEMVDADRSPTPSTRPSPLPDLPARADPEPSPSPDAAKAEPKSPAAANPVKPEPVRPSSPAPASAEPARPSSPAPASPVPVGPSYPASPDPVRDLAESLLADLDSQLDAVAAGDRDSVEFGAELVDGLMALEAVADKVKAVRLEKDRVLIETKSFGTILVYAKANNGTVGIDLWTRVGKMGDRELKFPLSLDVLREFDEDLPRRIEQEIGDLNTEVFSRDLMVTGVHVTPAGISAKVAEYDG